MTGKALSKVTFGDIPANDVVVCFKVMPRSQVRKTYIQHSVTSPFEWNVIRVPQPGDIVYPWHRRDKNIAVNNNQNKISPITKTASYLFLNDSESSAKDYLILSDIKQKSQRHIKTQHFESPY